jgi:alkylhydroperoxidase family enzyme
MRYDAFTQRIMDAVLAGPGHTPSELRRAVLARAARLAGARSGAPAPAPFATYVDKVAQHAYKVTDADVAALKSAGSSEDAVFEVTAAAALGAALGRLERGMAALRGEEPD